MPCSIQRFLLAVIILFTADRTYSQSSGNLWNNVKGAPQKAHKTLQKGGSRIKKWKDHLQQWGLDANYNHGFAIGAHINSNGWTGLMYYQRRINKQQSHFFQLSLSEIKHEKQIKQQRANTAFPELGGASPFVFGKVNNVYLLQLGHGREFLILPGVLEGNISVSFRAHAGISVAMLKPYYLKLIYVDYNPDAYAYVKEEKYSDKNSEHFLTANAVLGASKWSKGLNEITYVPGGYADAAIVIEPLKSKTFIKTVTLGANFSFHTKQLDIMADQQAFPWQGCLYAGLSLGKRWK